MLQFNISLIVTAIHIAQLTFKPNILPYFARNRKFWSICYLSRHVMSRSPTVYQVINLFFLKSFQFWLISNQLKVLMREFSNDPPSPSQLLSQIIKCSKDYGRGTMGGAVSGKRKIEGN